MLPRGFGAGSASDQQLQLSSTASTVKRYWFVMAVIVVVGSTRGNNINLQLSSLTPQDVMNMCVVAQVELSKVLQPASCLVLF